MQVNSTHTPVQLFKIEPVSGAPTGKFTQPASILEKTLETYRRPSLKFIQTTQQFGNTLEACPLNGLFPRLDGRNLQVEAMHNSQMDPPDLCFIIICLLYTSDAADE